MFYVKGFLAHALVIVDERKGNCSHRLLMFFAGNMKAERNEPGLKAGFS